VASAVLSDIEELANGWEEWVENERQNLGILRERYSLDAA
jgi:hypothetical protein